jgi:hypothetical protein
MQTYACSLNTLHVDTQEVNPAVVRTRRRLGTAAVALLTASVALASGIVGLIFDLRPDLRPFVRTTRAAVVAVEAVEQRVSADAGMRRSARRDNPYARQRANYLEEVLPGVTPNSGLRRKALSVRGQLFYVRIRAEGFKERSLILRWATYEFSSRRRLASDEGNRTKGSQIVGAAPIDTFLELVWTPAVPRPGFFVVRFELREPEGALLAIGDSARFAGCHHCG